MNPLDSPCTEIRAAFPLFVGNDLDPEESAAIEQHIDRCPACALSMEPWITMRGHFDRETRASHGAPVASLWDGVRTQMQREGILEPVGALPRLLALPRRRMVVGTLAAAAALLVFSFFFGPDQTGRGMEQTPNPLAGVGRPIPGSLVSSPLPAPGSRGLALRKANSEDRPLTENAVEVLHNLRLPRAGAANGAHRLTSGH